MSILDRCINAAEAMSADLSVVRKSDFPNRADFDSAIEELADLFQKNDGTYEHWYQTYSRALESPAGQKLYAAREWAPNPPEPVLNQQQEPVVQIGKAEQRIYDEVAKYVKAHPDGNPALAMSRVLDADQQLYSDYLLECFNRDGF